MADERPLLTTSGVATLLSVHPKHVFRLLKRGLPGHRLGGEWRFDAEQVLTWMREESSQERKSAALSLEPPPLLAANGDVCVELLLGSLAAAGAAPFGFVQSDCATGRQYLDEGRVLAAGVHGDSLASAGSALTLHVTRRSIAIAYVKGKRLKSLRELARVRLASRPPTAGVRRHLDHALVEAGLDSVKMHESAAICGSHRDVALSLLSGQADAGVLTVAWAERVGLACLPIADEEYGLSLRPEALTSERGRELVRTLQSRELRRKLAATPGYDPRDAGDLRV